MPYEIDWLSPERIILIQVLDDITDEHVWLADEQLMQMLQAHPQQLVHVIFDDTQAGTLPKAQVFSQIRWMRQENLGWVISYGGNSVLHRFFARFVTQFFGIRSRNLYSLEQAVDYLKQVDESLAEVQIPT